MKEVKPILFLLAIFSLILLLSCQSLDNGGGKDWVEVDVTIRSNKPNGQLASTTDGTDSEVISAVPSSISIPDLAAIDQAYDTQLQVGEVVTLLVPLNEELRLMKGVYDASTTVETVINDRPTPNSYGLSDPVIVTAADESVTVAISMTSAAGWQFVDGDGATGLNKLTTKQALSPHLLAFNNKLYLAWQEFCTGDVPRVRVREWDGTDWRFIDGGGDFGVYYDSGHQARDPRLISFGDELYIAFYHGNTTEQIRLAKWDGDSTWSFVDGNSSEGLNYSPAERAFSPVPVIFENDLYITWYEVSGSNTQIRLCLYSTSGSNCSFPGNSSATGLNFNTARSSRSSVLAVHGTTLFEIWEEYKEDSGDNGSIRAKKYESGTHTLIDGGETWGINYSNTNAGEDPAAVMFLDDLYVGWNEVDSNGISQIRVRKYNGSTWSWVDGGGETGLSHLGTVGAGWVDMIVFDEKLYAAWHELNEDGIAQIRVYRTSDGSVWEAVDGGEDDGLNKNPIYHAMSVKLAVFNDKLYLTFLEAVEPSSSIPDALFNVRVIEGNL